MNPRLKKTLENILLVLIAPLLALLLTTFVVHPYRVDGSSMEPTLQHNDRLIVLKLARSWSRLTGNPYVPNRGDIVVFVLYAKQTATSGSDRQIIKRVVGLPGERVVISDGQVTIFNEKHPGGVMLKDLGVFSPTESTATSDIDQIVPDGSLFVLGDNRNNSLDSRAVGTIPTNQVIGKLSFRIFPFDTAQKF